MSKKTYRDKQVIKILKEFNTKGYDIKKVFGKDFDTENIYDNDLSKFTKNKGNYNRFKERVKKEREHQKIVNEMNAYREKRNAKIVDKIQEGLYNVYGDQNTGEIYARRDKLGITLSDIRKGKNAIQQKIAKGFGKMLTDEMEYTHSKTKKKTAHGAFFRNTSEEDGVEERLKEIDELMKGDKNVSKNMSVVFEYLYEKIIPLKYEHNVLEDGTEVKPQYNTVHAKAPIEFFVNTADKLLKKYKELLPSDYVEQYERSKNVKKKK